MSFATSDADVDSAAPDAGRVFSPKLPLKWKNKSLEIKAFLCHKSLVTLWSVKCTLFHFTIQRDICLSLPPVSCSRSPFLHQSVGYYTPGQVYLRKQLPSNSRGRLVGRVKDWKTCLQKWPFFKFWLSGQGEGLFNFAAHLFPRVSSSVEHGL